MITEQKTKEELVRHQSFLGLSVLAVACLAVLVCVQTTAAKVRSIDTPALQQLVEQEGDAVFLLDVRTPGEYARGRIPGSVLIPMNHVPKRLAEIPRDKKIVVICASGARSNAVAHFLERNGYPWVANYEGGVFDFARRGLPLER
jgi:rhodanese-related sulfurtransferase